MNGRHYILDGHAAVPVDLMTWARWLEEHAAERVVARTERDGVIVSTVFLGLDHAYGGGTLHIFETMVFGSAHDGDTARYATWAEAEGGHERMVAAVWP